MELERLKEKKRGGGGLKMENVEQDMRSSHACSNSLALPALQM